MRYFISILLLIFSVPSAWTASASDTLAQQLNQVVLFSSDFKQQVRDEAGHVLQQSSGKVQFKRPSLFYWHVISPTSQTLWYRDNTLIIYDPELAQATIKKIAVATDPSLLPLRLLTGDADQVLKNFSVQRDHQRYILKPTAINEEGLLLGVVLELTSNGAVHKIQYQTTLGQIISIIFSQCQINTIPNQAHFFEKLPMGTDMINVD